MNSYRALTAINAMALCIYAGHAIRTLVLRWYARRAMRGLARGYTGQDKRTASRGDEMRDPLVLKVLMITSVVMIVLSFVSRAFASPCPPSGDGGDPVLNTAKNRVDAPAQPTTMDVSQILALKMTNTKLPRARWTAAQRKVLDLEGRGVVVVGYLIGVKEEGPESANCHGTDHDFHMYLAAAPGDPKSEAVVIEITPRQHAAAWTLSAMKQLVRWHVEVRVTGWLLYDQEHGPDVGKSRGTLWEIHPVTGIEVLSGAKWVKVGGRG